MFEGGAKISLMNELCRADAIPKEYLQNVAVGLAKKVRSKPEFDTQSLRSSDIILELLEKSSKKCEYKTIYNMDRLTTNTVSTLYTFPYLPKKIRNEDLFG